MIRPMLAAALAATLALPAAAQQSGSLWRHNHQNGIDEYLTGEWDSPTGGALNISCLRAGRAAIVAQIKGQAPPANSQLRLTVSTRAGSREAAFRTDAQGAAELSFAEPAFRQLWANLRAGDIVTLRYADGRTSVQSLAGAQKTLPATPCG
jgi:hypothetical protein